MLRTNDRLALDKLVIEAAEKYGVRVEVIKGKFGPLRASTARREVMVWAWNHGLSCLSIAEYFGRSHATVLYLLGQTTRKPKHVGFYADEQG